MTRQNLARTYSLAEVIVLASPSLSPESRELLGCAISADLETVALYLRMILDKEQLEQVFRALHGASPNALLKLLVPNEKNANNNDACLNLLSESFSEAFIEELFKFHFGVLLSKSSKQDAEKIVDLLYALLEDATLEYAQSLKFPHVDGVWLFNKIAIKQGMPGRRSMLQRQADLIKFVLDPKINVQFEKPQPAPVAKSFPLDKKQKRAEFFKTKQKDKSSPKQKHREFFGRRRGSRGKSRKDKSIAAPAAPS